MSYYLEMAKAVEQIKDQALYDFINLKESKGNETAFKKKMEAFAKENKIDRSKINETLSKIDEKISEGNFKVRLQKHISLPAAIYIIQNKKTINANIIETLVATQKKSYYSKNLKDIKNQSKAPIKDNTVSNNLVKEMQKEALNPKEIAFVAYYWNAVLKINKSKNIEEIKNLFPDADKNELKDLDSMGFEKIKSVASGYRKGDIIFKLKQKTDLLGNNIDPNKVKNGKEEAVALIQLLADVIGQHSWVSNAADTTRSTMGSRKEIKKAEKVKDLKSQKDSGSITKNDLERMLSAVPGYNAIQKTKRDRVEDVVSKIASKRSEIIEKLLELQKQRAKESKEKANNWKERISKIDKQIKELSKSIGSTSSATLWSDLRNNINSVVGNLLDEKPKQQIVNVVKKAMKGPKMSDNSMDFMKDLMSDSFSFKPKKGSRSLLEAIEDINGDGQIDDYEISFYNFLNDLRKSRVPKGIIEPYSVPERHKDNCEKCQNLLYDYWVNSSLYNMKSEIKGEIIKKKYAEISKGIFQTIPDDNYLSDKQYSVLRGGKEVGRYEKEGDAKAFINSLVKKHIEEKPGIPQGLITKQYDIKKS